jgi:hypothetical protein
MGMNDLIKKAQGEPDAFDQACSCCPKMTRMQRLYAFCATFCIGWMISFISAFTLFGKGSIKDKIPTFVVFYVLGSTTAITA